LEKENEQRKLTQFSILEKKNLWAMLHNATPDALSELYHITMYRFGLSELGNMLREYLKKHKGYGSPEYLKRCPYCGVEDPPPPKKKAPKVRDLKATKKEE